MSAPEPTRLGRYRLEEVIGTGAFSTVYRAVDERLEDVVAVKVLAENHSFDPEVRERFLTEGRVLRRIDSPHVTAVHDRGRPSGRSRSWCSSMPTAARWPDASPHVARRGGSRPPTTCARSPGR